MHASISQLSGDCCTPKARGFTMDTPVRRGSAPETPITRLLGQALGNPGLARMRPEDKHSEVMTRANNLSSLTAAMLLKIRPEKREAALIEVAGLSYTQHVLAFAKNYPGGLGITDAIRFSLALHFLLGILDVEAKRSTFLADGYLAFAKLFKAAQNRRSGKYTGEVRVEQPKGLGGLGAHPILAFETVPRSGETPLQAIQRAQARAKSWDDWCARNAGQTYDPALLNKCQNPPLYCDAKDPATAEGQQCRGLMTGWVKPVAARSYPMPPDRPSVDPAKVNAAACGDIFWSLDEKRRQKVAGVRRMFPTIFGRAPNNTEVEYWASTRWCAFDTGIGIHPNPAFGGEGLKNKMVAVRDGIIAGTINTTIPAVGAGGIMTEWDLTYRDVGTDIGEGLQKAADAAIDFIGKTVDFITDIMCKGFKEVFGAQVGGVLCDILTFMTRMMTAGVQATIDIVVESLKGTFEFIKLMIAGKMEEAFTALLRTMGRVLFSLSAPMMVPILMADKGVGRSASQAFAELKVRADRVTKKEPLWPLMVVMAVVGVFSAIGGNVLGAITGVVTALAPMVATFLSEPLKANIAEMRDTALEEIETGIVKFVKFVLLIFNGAMAIKDIVGKFRGQLAAFMKKQSFSSLTGGGKIDPATGKPLSATNRIKYILDKFQAGANAITNAFKNFNVKDIVQSAGPLLALIPELLLAILPDDAAESMPTLTEWRDTVAKSVANTNEVEATLRAGAADLFKTFSLDTKVSFIKDEVKAIPPQQAAVIAAQAVGQQFKNTAQFPTFVASFKAELLKV